jgi:hypothetical protein
MFNSVKSIAIATTVSFATMSSLAFAQEAPKFSEITVNASLVAAEGSNAMDVFPQITDDLLSAISALVPGSDNAQDPVIKIDIRKITLNGNPLLTGSNEFNEIEGVVDIADQSGNVEARSFPVNISAYTSDRAVPEGYVSVPPSADDFYVVMVNAFAEVVAERANDLNAVSGGSDK